MTLVIRHLRIEIWTSLHEIPIKSEGVFFWHHKISIPDTTIYK